MSFHAVLWACKQDLSPVSKLVLVALSTFASKNDGSCFPKVATIAAMASVSPRTVHRRLPELADKQLVRVERNFKGKARLPHRYWLACGGDQRSKAMAQTRSVTTGYDNGGNANDHYQNHYIDTRTHVPGVGLAPLARQERKQARSVVSATSEVDQATQVELARRLGMSGWEIMCAFEDEVSHLCFLLRKNALTSAHLSELRRRYAALIKQPTKHGE
ncbi:MAG: helix-turn-helix domain-containing protein [Afipia sp.]|nr:helix-turn-helix domain-containing protein [Afipia sp.]